MEVRGLNITLRCRDEWREGYAVVCGPGDLLDRFANDIKDCAKKAAAAATLTAIFVSLFIFTPQIKKALAMLCVARLKAPPRSLLGRRLDSSSMSKTDENKL